MSTEPPSRTDRERDRREPTQHKPGSARTRLIAAGLLGIVAVIGVVVLFSGGSESVAEPPPAVTQGSVEFVDGTLTVVEDTRLVLEPFEGAEMRFAIAEADRPNFDIAHMQSHSSVALPTRIYYERNGEQLNAVYKEDAPANSQGG